jgi:O-antigen/teichoic acid export membrane protein
LDTDGLTHDIRGRTAGRPGAARRFALIFGSATIVAQLAQVGWLALGSRVMSRESFGAILAAQALYGVLQYVVDNGPAFHGARLAAAGALTQDVRGSLIRLRLQLAAACGIAIVAVGFAGGYALLRASAPFALALVLWALLNYWEPFGEGDGRPWSAYLVLRAAGPALAAGVLLVAGHRFPLVLAGLIECAALAGVALFFRLRMVSSAGLALRAGRGPWLVVATVGLPSMLWQASLASGTVLLGIVGATAAAAALAVSVRLLSGVNQLTGVVSTALFPSLARSDGAADARPFRRSVGLALRVVFLLAAAASAITLAIAPFVVSLLLNHSGRDAQATAVLTVTTSACAGYAVLLNIILIARHHERAAVPAFLAGALVTVGGGIAVLVTQPHLEPFWMATALTIGLTCTAAWLTRSGARLFPSLARTLGVSLFAAVAFSTVGFAAGLVPSLRAPLAIVLSVAGALLARGALPAALAAKRTH